MSKVIDVIKTKEYQQMLNEIKGKVRSAQIKAAIKWTRKSNSLLDNCLGGIT